MTIGDCNARFWTGCDIHINFLAVIIAAAAYFLFGALWYSSGIFGQSWQTDAGVVPSKEHHVGSYIGEFIVDLVIAYVLALFIKLVNANSVTEALLTALWIWVGFVATHHVSAMLHQVLPVRVRGCYNSTWEIVFSRQRYCGRDEGFTGHPTSEEDHDGLRASYRRE